MLELNQLKFSFGGDLIFEDLNLFVKPGDKVGLIGKNGAGKSTLFKIINGKLTPESGQIQLQKGIKLAQLDQDIELPLEELLIDYVMSAFGNMQSIDNDLEQLQHKLETDTNLDDNAIIEIADRIYHLEEQRLILGAGQIEAKAELTLTGLGFKQSELKNPLRTFSGGWRMRAELARLLLIDPDLLLLDEPTNHLDIESILWLENWFKSFKGALILISHDTYFLENTVTSIWDLRHRKIFDYKGHYKKYLVDREDLDVKQQASHENQQKKIKDLQRTADRFRAKASKAKLAQSLDKMIAKEVIIDAPLSDNDAIKISWPDFHAGGREILKVEQLTHSYDNVNVILKDVDLLIERGDHVAFVGKNGEGKSTLAKLINKELNPSSGEVQWGYKADPYYFDQYQSESLDGNMTVLDTLERNNSHMSTSEVRSLLGSFLFSGATVEKKVKVLSGGEKNRLALAKMIMEAPNFLILDEPTNHLDIQARRVLKKALNDYKGTLIVVSHDRYFLEELTSKTYYFENKKIREYLGDINYVLEERGFNDIRQLEKKTNKKKKTKQVSTPEIQNSPIENESDKPKLNSYQINELKKEISKIEKKIGRLEEDKGKLELTMGEPDFYQSTKSNEVLTKYNEVKGSITVQYELWEEKSTLLG